ncbi:MAG TPA: acetylxylan esterase, partial [Chloroflexota bacterium]|nr:acetylxylan esterase [Chloroflexota bacterium]
MARFLHRPEDFRVLHAPYEALLEEHYARHGLDVVHEHPYPDTLQEWQSQRTFLRRRLIEALGLRPELVQGPASARGDLRARVTGRVDRARDGYYVELVEFQSREGFYVSANLYLPADVPAGARLPAVFSPHGHWQAGKHSSHVQLRSINLARRGYVVLVVDTIGHAERRFMGHREPAAHALLYAGESLPGLQVWDNIRALDYLGSRPEVDPTRIGVTGASGGGNHTMYLAAVDERVAVAVPVCSVEMLEVAFRKSQCVCETVPGLLTFADKPHILGLIAPRPLLIMNGMRDGGFPTLSARRAYDHTERIYRLYEGGEARLALYETNVEHSYDRAMRERAYAWFDRWLKEGASQTAGARSASPGEGADLGETETWIEAEEDDTLCVWGAGVHAIPGRSRRSLDPGGGPGGAGPHPQDAHTLDTYYAAATSEAQLPSPPAMPAAERRRRLTSLFGTWPARAPLQVEHVDTTER